MSTHFWTAVASAARHRFRPAERHRINWLPRALESAVAAPLCRRTPKNLLVYEPDQLTPEEIALVKGAA